MVANMVFDPGKTYPNIAIAAQGIASDYASVREQETFRIIADVGKMKFVFERASGEYGLLFPTHAARKIDRLVRLLKDRNVPIDETVKCAPGLMRVTKVVYISTDEVLKQRAALMELMKMQQGSSQG